METNKIQITKSLQNLLQIEIESIFNSTRRARSLPNIGIPLTPDSLYQYHPDFSAIKKQHHHTILKKTWDKVKTAIIHSTSSHSCRRGSLKQKQTLNFSPPNSAVSSAPSTPMNKKTFEFDTVQPNSSSSCRPKSRDSYVPLVVDATRKLGGESNEGESPEIEESEKIQRSYAKLQKRLSEELHQRMSEHKPDPKHATENLSEDFKKRLRQWEMWKVSTGKVTYTDEELLLILPEDFQLKLHEWETIKTSGIHHSHSKTPDSLTSNASVHTRDTSSPEVTPISSKNKLLRKKKSSSDSKQKELAWLDKQLEKVEGEKKRLEREMKKYNERKERLEKMKEALQNTSQNEVWIRTPTAKCKVEKLTEKFTKKLYEWEEKQGIQPESSTMALLHPKYYGPPPNEDEIEMEKIIQAEFNEARYDDDTPAVSSSRESESRQDECDAEKVEIWHHNDPEPEIIEHDYENHLEDHISSASSSDFEEATDSFATHEKGNSGASNTDSDFYRAEFPSRRRSSEAISTPLSARSPSLSAFTSDDEGESCGLLKTVSEENENTNTLKDAESQTEVILKAKMINLEDDEDNEESLADDSQFGIFVQTKRTIFSPILDETEPEKVILIEQSPPSSSPTQKFFQETRSGIRTPSPLPTDILPCFSSSTKSFSISRLSSASNQPRPPPPRIVEAFPKISPQNCAQPPSPQRAFPKMGKIPVWCSPNFTRRHLGGGNFLNHSSSVDFTTDKGFLVESNLYSQHSSVPCSSTSLATSPPITSKTFYGPYKTGGPRRNTSAALPEESGIVGAGIQTGQRHPAFLPVRSSSFRFHRPDHHDQNVQRPKEPAEASKSFYANLKNKVGSVVTKSQSTGSIISLKNRFGKLFHNKKDGSQNQAGSSSRGQGSQGQAADDL